MKDCNGPGSFLIRESVMNPGDFVLSLRGEQGVAHYPIKYEWLDSGSYSITSQVSFASLTELVTYFHQPSANLCTVLSSPCVKAEKPPTSGLSKHANKEWSIDRREIRLHKKIGAGSFAETWEGLWNEKMPVAVKTIKPGLVDRSEFLAEADVIRKFEHPNLLQLYAVCSKGEPIYMVTELMKHGSLLDLVRHNPCGKGISLKHVDLIDMAAQVASGMAYLEEKDYIHRNLAAKNILVGEYLICKVADLGFTNLISEDDYMHWFPIKWTAPEAALYNCYSMKSDVWSFGIVLHEIFTNGRIPYAGFATRDVLEAVSEGSYRMPCPPNCPPKLYDIMLDCWSQEPDNRPSFTTLQLQLEEFFTSDESSS
jgi:fyn-related kinase